MITKQSLKETEAAKTFTRKNKKTTSVKNAGIKRPNVLSSGRRLPSTKGALHLAGMVEAAHQHLKAVEKRFLERNEIVTRQIIFSEKFKRQPKRAFEDPNNWLLDQQLQTINAEMQEAAALYDLLQSAYKRTTGKLWKPRPDVNKSADLEF
jgi:hypothetical protein